MSKHCAHCGGETGCDYCADYSGLSSARLGSCGAANAMSYDDDICHHCGRGGSEFVDGHETAKEEYRPQLIAATEAIAELARYFTSGNSIPVERAVIRADDFWKIVSKAGFERHNKEVSGDEL